MSGEAAVGTGTGPEAGAGSGERPVVLNVRSGDVGLSVHDYGGRPRTPPLLLLHGIRDSAWSMQPLAAAFADRYRVLALDLRGHGDSDKPGLYTLPHFVADLHTLIESLGLQDPILVGHSLGGQIVAQYAGIYCEVPKGVAIIEGLGPPLRALESSAEGRRQLRRESVEMLLDLRAEHRSMAGIEEALERFAANHPRLEPERARFLVERAVAPDERGGLRWKWDPRVQSTWATATREAREEPWSWIRCPVLLVTAGRSEEFWRRRRGMVAAGGEEEVRREHERRLALFADAEHVEIADAGHMIHFDAPQALSRSIGRFLARRLG